MKTYLMFLILLSVTTTSQAQTQGTDDDFRDLFPISSWCADSGTACWDDNDWFSGVRIVAEIDLGFIFQGGGNQFENTLNSLNKVALEFNIYKGWVAFQVGLFAPGKVTLDERSPSVLENRLTNENSREVSYKYGLIAGLTFLDGSIATGLGGFWYDRRAFKPDLELKRGEGRDRFVYVALQPISSIRASFKEAKEN